MKDFYFLLVLVGITLCTAAAQDDENAENFEKPCGPNNDFDCIRKYFKDNAHCSLVNDFNDSMVYEVNLPIYVPSVNLTVVTTKTISTEMDGTFEEFYFNKKTRKFVISIKFEGFIDYAPDTIFAISRNGKEPIVLTDYANATYPVVLTAVIPTSLTGDITTTSLKKGDYSAHFFDNNAVVELGPNLADSTDPVVQAMVEAILNDLPTVLLEIYRTKASYIFLGYLQSYICNFDLSPALENYDLTVMNSEIAVNNDETDLNMPCANSDDVTACVIKYFKDNGECTVPRTVNDDTLRRGAYSIPVPILNSTLYALHGEWSHGSLRGRIENFYTNNQTGNLVMSVTFSALTMFTPQIYLSTQHKGAESTVVSDYSKHIYPVTITAVIPTSNGLTSDALKKSFVTGHFTQPALFSVGPKYLESKDPEMIKIVNTVYSNPLKLGQECFVTEALPSFLAYLQKYICDFGI